MVWLGGEKGSAKSVMAGLDPATHAAGQVTSQALIDVRLSGRCEGPAWVAGSRPYTFMLPFTPADVTELAALARVPAATAQPPVQSHGPSPPDPPHPSPNRNDLPHDDAEAIATILRLAPSG